MKALLLAFTLIFAPAWARDHYLNFDDNFCLDKHMKKEIKPHLLPADHPLKNTLDQIFSGPRVIENEIAFAEAGFETLQVRPGSFIVIARHPLLPGYLLKLYLDNETRQKDGVPGWKWLVNRCKGAENIRTLIRKKNLKHFIVPDKWLYPLPPDPKGRHPIVLLVTAMNLVSQQQNKQAWLNVTEEHLDELYSIISYGYASCDLFGNIQYTKEGKFACIDTEHPKRKLKLSRIRPHLSELMQTYWNKLIGKRE